MIDTHLDEKENLIALLPFYLSGTLEKEETAQVEAWLQSDPDAGAIALLTLDETGRAFVSTHGHFPNLAARTFPGECTKDAS